MLDYFGVFTRGGALLWTLQFTALRHSAVEALNALIRTCLLEERSGDNTFTYVPKAGAHQALKWTYHNVSSCSSLGQGAAAWGLTSSSSQFVFEPASFCSDTTPSPSSPPPHAPRTPCCFSSISRCASLPPFLAPPALLNALRPGRLGKIIYVQLLLL